MGEKSKKAKVPKEKFADGQTATESSVRDKKKKKSKKSTEDKAVGAEQEVSESPGPHEGSKSNAKKEKGSKRKRDASNELADTETATEAKVAGEEAATEPPKKKKKKKDAAEADKGKSEKKEKRRKKRDRDRSAANGDQPHVEDGTVEGAKEDIEEGIGVMKNKKKKSEENKGPEVLSEVDEQQKSGEKGKKKRKHKHKHKDKDGDTVMADASAEDANGSAKEGEEKAEGKEKDKKSKKQKSTGTTEKSAEKGAPTSATTAAPADDLAERWNVRDLGGGESRQNKFMRLLGGKKAGVAVFGTTNAKEKDGPRQKFDINRVSQELEKQFDASIQMKFGSGGQRKGLGA